MVLGRGVVVAGGGPVPPPWAAAPEVVVDDDALDDPAEVVGRLHRAWLQREPVVVRLLADPADFREPASMPTSHADLRPDIETWPDRLHHLVWVNCYDARNGEPVWWWARKAARLGAVEGGPADVVLPDGRPAWVDGGPRQPLGPADTGGHAAVSSETVELGMLRAAPPPAAPSADLAPDQLAAVSHAAGPARIIAPAGSGKTRVLTERLRHLLADRGYEPQVVRAVAFNVRAADEMRDRTAGLGATVQTLNALGRWVLVEAAGRAPELLDEWRVRRVLERIVELPRQRVRANTDPLAPYLEGVSRIRLGLRDPAAVEAEVEDADGLAERVWPRFREAMRREGGIDFDEQVYAAVEALLRDGGLRRRLQRSCRHLLVDEFQDLTPVHMLLVRLLAGPPADVFGVGDDDQTIYGYTGASPAFLVRYEDWFPGATPYALEVNYRCPAAVVERAGTLLSWNRLRVDKHVRPAPGADPDPAALRVELHPPEQAAGRAVAIVEGWLEAGGQPQQAAVLARVNALLMAPAVALREAGIPVAADVDARLLDRTGVRAALAYLRLAADPERMSGADVTEVLRRPSRGSLPQWLPDRLRRRRWTPEGLDELAATLQRPNERENLSRVASDLRAVSRAAAGAGGVRAALVCVRDDVGLGHAMGLLDASKPGQGGGSHLDDIEALIQVADLHPELDGFDSWLRDVLSRPGDPGGVTLASVHRVKGQEWDDVLLFGAAGGILPHRLSEDVEEERRILHVALTRARRRAVVLADATRPSPFLPQLERARAAGEVDRARSPRPAEGGTRAPSRSGRAAPPPGAGAGAGDRAVAAAVREWRRRRAAAEGKPAYVYLSDATIDELALRPPRSVVQLRQVRGIGPAKLEQFGDELLTVIADAAPPDGDGAQ